MADASTHADLIKDLDLNLTPLGVPQVGTSDALHARLMQASASAPIQVRLDYNIANAKDRKYQEELKLFSERALSLGIPLVSVTDASNQAVQPTYDQRTRSRQLDPSKLPARGTIVYSIDNLVNAYFIQRLRMYSCRYQCIGRRTTNTKYSKSGRARRHSKLGHPQLWHQQSLLQQRRV